MIPTIAICTTDLCRLVLEFGGIIQMLIFITASLALLVFFWGLVKYIAKADDPSAKEQGKNIMTYGVIALFVLFFIWGILYFIQDAFFIGDIESVSPPQIEL